MWLGIILAGLVTLLFYILFVRKTKDFWEEYGIAQLPHSSFKDNLDIFLGKKTTPELDEIMYKSLGATEKVCGFIQLGTPSLFVKDLNIVKKIMIKDFDHFVDRRTIGTSKAQPLFGKMLVNLHGEEWKGTRSCLSPTFTTGKIRRMMEYFNLVSNDWASHFNDEIKKNDGNPININVNKECTMYTVDLISSAVFGMDVGTVKNPDSLFAKMAQQLIYNNLWIILKFAMSVSLPWVIDLFRLKVIDDESLTFFETILRRQLKEREEKKEKRNDFLQLILESRRGELKADGSDELSAFEKEAMMKDTINSEKKNLLKDDTSAVAQMLGFFFAGFTTTSNVIGTVMYCIALNQDIQDKMREEINSSQLFKDGGHDMDYDILNKLPYLDMVLCETLRLYPVLGRLERICVKNYTDSENGWKIPKGALIAIPAHAIHRDPQYYDHPEKFYPEHFSAEQKAKRNPYAWLPFGTGPRNCIGMRFALVESKAAIAHLLKNFRLEPAATTPIPQKMKPAGIAVQIPDSLELRLCPIN